MLGAVRVRMLDYMVHLKTDTHILYFEAYPVQDWTHLPTGEQGTSYIDKENEPDEREVFEDGKWLGSSSSSMRKYSLNDQRFKTREYSLGFDFYANGDLLHTKCTKCGKTDFVSV